MESIYRAPARKRFRYAGLASKLIDIKSTVGMKVDVKSLLDIFEVLTILLLSESMSDCIDILQWQMLTLGRATTKDNNKDMVIVCVCVCVCAAPCVSASYVFKFLVNFL